jgi:hypothetical protein
MVLKRPLIQIVVFVFINRKSTVCFASLLLHFPLMASWHYAHLLLSPFLVGLFQGNKHLFNLFLQL